MSARGMTAQGLTARDAMWLYGDLVTSAPRRRWHDLLIGCLGACVVVALLAFGQHLDATDIADEPTPEVVQLAAAERERLAMGKRHPQVLAAYEAGLADGAAAIQHDSLVCGGRKGR